MLEIKIWITAVTLLVFNVPAGAQTTSRSYELGEPLTQPAPRLPAGLTITATDHRGTCHVTRDLSIKSERDVTKAVGFVINEFQKTCPVVGSTISIEQSGK